MTFPPDNIQPMVTVLMPVYNAARYLREALESVLSQTYRDFELLVIDDASTDASADLVGSFHDPRIRLLRNDSNLGVARTLNRGAQLARGRYLARMDADDVCLPERLKRQVEYLELHPEVEVLGTRVELIGADGGEIGVWQADREAVTAEEIRSRLPQGNCLAHPSVMMRRELLLCHPYHEKVPYAQDYELWLRLAAHGCRIEKLDQVLLRHRVHQGSVTFKSNRSGSDLKNVRIKSVCLGHWFAGRLPSSSFMRSVIRELVVDLYRLSMVRGKGLVRETLVRAGMLCGTLFPPRKRPGLYFFFPFYHVGGAERVHADIVKLVHCRNPWVVITHRSQGTALKHEFARAGRLFDLSRHSENLVLKALWRGYFATVINRSANATVFGSNTDFYYSLLPYLRAEVRAADLIHAFGGGIEWISLPCAERIERRFVVNQRTLEDMERQYAREGLPGELAGRILVVENGVRVPPLQLQTAHGEQLRVLYVGRGTEEKRAHLVPRIVSLCNDWGMKLQCRMAGDLSHAAPVAEMRHCRLVGELHDPEAIAALYRESDLLLVPSSREGFPLVVMEAMAHGVVPIATDVGGLSSHLTNGANGFLVQSGCGEQQIVHDFAAVIRELDRDRARLHRLSEAAYSYAAQHFTGEKFEHCYRKFFGEV